MARTPRPVWPWALGFSLLVIVPIVILLVAPPDVSFEVATPGNDQVVALVVAGAIGAVGLGGCALVWQLRVAREARRDNQSALKALAVIVGALVAPWLIGLVAMGLTGAAASLLTVGLMDIATIAAIAWLIERRAAIRAAASQRDHLGVSTRP
jgi:hypothetical protein